MTLSEYGNVPTHVSKKKIFALVAVALMLCSVFAVFVATEQTTAANAENKQISLEWKGAETGWKATNAPSESSGWHLYENILTLTNFNYVCTDTGTNVFSALRIEGESGNSGLPVLTIKIVGKCSITYQSSPNNTNSYAIAGGGSDITIEGSGSDSTLDLIAINNSSVPSKIGGFDNEHGLTSIKNLKLNITTDKASTRVTGLSCDKAVIENSKITVNIGDGDNQSSGFIMGDLEVSKQSQIDIKTGKANLSVGIGIIQEESTRDGARSITDSTINLETGESPSKTSIGLLFDGNLTVKNSTFTAQGKDSAVAHYDAGKIGEAPTSTFDGLTLKGTKADGTEETITGSTISRDYVKVTGATVTHKLSYNLDGGSGNVPAETQIAEGGSFTVTDVVPTKSGYTFDGWKDAKDKKYEAGKTYTMGSEDIELKAIWKQSTITHKFSYNLLGGSGDVPAETQIAEGGSFTVTDVVPTKSGYTFDSWQDANGNKYEAGKTYQMGNADIILTAVWKQNSSGGNSDNTVLYVVMAILVVIIIILAFLVYYFYKKCQPI